MNQKIVRFLLFYLILGLFFKISGIQAQQVPGNSTRLPDIPSFTKVLLGSDLMEILKKGRGFTVFVPSDHAFEKEYEQLNLLYPNPHNQLKSLISYHIVAGHLTASRILQALCRGEGTAIFTTVQGEELVATLDGVDIVLMDCSGNTARIISADQSSENLVFHEMDGIVLPPIPIP